VNVANGTVYFVVDFCFVHWRICRTASLLNDDVDGVPCDVINWSFFVTSRRHNVLWLLGEALWWRPTKQKTAIRRGKWLDRRGWRRSVGVRPGLGPRSLAMDHPVGNGDYRLYVLVHSAFLVCARNDSRSPRPFQLLCQRSTIVGVYICSTQNSLASKV